LNEKPLVKYHSILTSKHTKEAEAGRPSFNIASKCLRGLHFRFVVDVYRIVRWNYCKNTLHLLNVI